MKALGTWDYVAMAAYFAITAIIGFSVSRRKTTSDDLFLAGRSLGPWAVGFSLFASNISSDTLVGLPGAAYETGISAANYEWMAGVLLIFSTFFVIPVLMRSEVNTVPELMQRRFDARMRTYLASVTLFLSIILDTAGSLYAGALVSVTFLPSVTITETCFAIALFAGLYTAAGGLKAVVYTDFMQAVVLLIGALALSIIVFGKFDYDWSKVVAEVPADKLSLLRPLSDPGVPWLGLLTGLPVVGFYYWTMNQYVVQRILGARDLRTAGRASVIAACLKLLPLFLMVLPGAMAIHLLPGLKRADQVFPRMVAEFTPTGMTGLILAGLVAALMSTCSSTLNSAATLITLDFVKPRRPDWSSEKLAWTGRVVTLGLALFAAVWAPQIRHFAGLWAYLQQVFAFAASPLVAVFVMGFFVPALGPRAAFRGLASGHLFAALFAAAYFLDWVPIHFTILGGIVAAVTAAMTYGFMAWLGAADRPAPDDARLACVARRGLKRASWDVRMMACIVAACIALLLWLFR